MWINVSIIINDDKYSLARSLETDELCKKSGKGVKYLSIENTD